VKLWLAMLPSVTLLRKECLRFLAVPTQTVFTPVITSALFLFIFGVTLGRRIDVGGSYTYLQFVIPGLTLMGVINNAFANTSSSLFFSRYIGNIVDVLVTPIGPFGFLTGYCVAAVIRGLVVGVVILVVAAFFSAMPWAHPGLALGMGLLTAFELSLLGVVAAIYSETFEAIAMYTNFLLLPLVYLGGMFYPVSTLPPVWSACSRWNPLYYSIEGFRHSILGTGETPLAVCFAVVGFGTVALAVWAYVLVDRGYRLRQ